MKNDCWWKEKIRERNIIVEDNRFFVATTLITKGKDPTWYIDIRTTQHMVHEITSFSSYKPWQTSQVVYLGDDISHHIKEQGDLSIVLSSGKMKIIPNVLYVLNLINNLFFLNNLDEVRANEMIIKYGRCIFKSPNGVIITNCMLEMNIINLAPHHKFMLMLLPYQHQFNWIRHSYGTSV